MFLLFATPANSEYSTVAIGANLVNDDDDDDDGKQSDAQNGPFLS
jgi:hypothetical protein